MANTNMERCLPSLMFIQTEVYIWEGNGGNCYFLCLTEL